MQDTLQLNYFTMMYDMAFQRLPMYKNKMTTMPNLYIFSLFTVAIQIHDMMVTMDNKKLKEDRIFNFFIDIFCDLNKDLLKNIKLSCTTENFAVSNTEENILKYCEEVENDSYKIYTA